MAYAGIDNAIKCYTTSIFWDDQKGCLCFEELDRDDSYAQKGELYFHVGSPYMYLMTIEIGRVRTIVMSQFRGNVEHEILGGLINSLYRDTGALYPPITVPIAMVKEPEKGVPGDLKYGTLKSGDPYYDEYIQYLRDILSGSFARIVVPDMGAIYGKDMLR